MLNIVIYDDCKLRCVLRDHFNFIPQKVTQIVSFATLNYSQKYIILSPKGFRSTVALIFIGLKGLLIDVDVFLQ